MATSGVCHALFSYKVHFLQRVGVAGQEQSHAPNLQDLKCLQSGLSNEVFFVFLLFLTLSKLDENQN